MSDPQPGFQTLLVTGIARLLADAGAGVWHPDGSVYTATDTAIVLKNVPTSPDNVISLTTYPVSDDPTLSDSMIGLQAHTRGAGPDSRVVDDIADAVFDTLQGLNQRALSTGIHVYTCTHRSGVSLGQDDLKRWARSDNYYLNCWRPSPNRT